MNFQKNGYIAKGHILCKIMGIFQMDVLPNMPILIYSAYIKKKQKFGNTGENVIVIVRFLLMFLFPHFFEILVILQMGIFLCFSK